MPINNLQEILRRHKLGAGSLRVLLDRGEENIFGLTYHGSEVIERRRELRGLVDETGYWPVILGSPGDYKFLSEPWDTDPLPPETIVERGLSINPEAWLQKQSAEVKEAAEEDPGVEESIHGDWPNDAAPNSEFTLHYDFSTSKPHPEVYLALIPTRVSWQAPAFLKFGGWNECPNSEEHVALLKRWHELYGAEVVGMSGDTLELWVSSPPSNRKAALTLANEQYLYCPDIVTQGVGTIEVLAATLLCGSTWFFWWD